ncbi:MAG: D-2-hydroxyacid dehydrogenase [Verrucomicrobia bacterium]|nr:D-2-hydroxyacid dehydrogenase [Verrucomicrobiota bacterium]
MTDATSHQLVFLDAATMACDGDIDLRVLEKFGTLTEYAITVPGETAQRLIGSTIALTNKVVIGAREMDAAGASLKLIVVCATGTNNIDLEAASERKIGVCNVSGYSTAGVAQHVFALLLNLVTHCHRYVSEPEKWADSPVFTRMNFPIIELNGKMLGIAGYGAIGRKVAEVGRALGMNVQALQRSSSAPSDGAAIARVQLKEFFESSDVISLHCPLSPETEKMINAESLSWMRPGGFIINTGRGGLVDEGALLEALNNGHLGGAGLDVLSVEPPPTNHPLLTTRLPNLLITPHIAWSAIESRHLLIDGVMTNIRSFLDGGSANRLV